MDCAGTVDIKGAEFLKGLIRKAAAQNVPLAGSIDITDRCNLRCIHCYQADRLKPAAPKEMSASHILSLLDAMADAGCLYLLITGGEPLIRPDFPLIYRHAKEMGLVITLFTNGTLITDDLLVLFQDLPPNMVEVSLYGSTAETYGEITGVGNAFNRCMDGVRDLISIGLDVRLKTILMTANRHELAAMEAIASDLGVQFRFDAAIFPRFNGDVSPVGLRVPPDDAVAYEFSDKERADKWADFFGRVRDITLFGDRLYQCGSGRTSFHVDAEGFLRPCLMIREIGIDTSVTNFRDGWALLVDKVSREKASSDFICSGCDRVHLCGYCPAFFSLETGFAEKPVQYLCSLGEQRYRYLNNSFEGA